MSTVKRLRKGLDIKVVGHAANKLESTFSARTFALKPRDFIGLSPIPKLLVQE